MNEFMQTVEDFESAVDDFAAALYFDATHGKDYARTTRKRDALRALFDAEIAMVNAGEDAGVTWKMNSGIVSSEFAGLRRVAEMGR